MRSVPVPRAPNYFFRVLPNKPWIAYNSRARNFLLNYETGKEIKLPGMFDTIPLVEGDLISIPYGILAFDRMKFYDVERLIRGDSFCDALVYEDKHLPGAYQTFGIINTDEDGTQHYRIVTESILDHMSGFYTQKYAILKKEDGSYSITKEGTTKDAEAICGKSARFALPMLSKSGMYLAGVDPQTRNTKIMKVSDDGICEDVVLFDFPTGKLDFSYDDAEVVFHVNTAATGKAIDFQHFRKIRKDVHLELMTFRLGDYLSAKYTSEDKPDLADYFETVIPCPGKNCYYPTYLADNNVAFLVQNETKPEFEFVFINRD